MKKKAAVFISAGLGDALLLVPLLKQLNRDGVSVTGIFTGNSGAEIFFQDNDLLEKKIVIKNNIAGIFKCIFLFRQFERVYLNYFAASRGNFLLSSFLTNQIITNRVPENLPRFILNEVKFIEPVKNIHDATQNLRFAQADYTDSMLHEQDLELNFHTEETGRNKFPELSEALASEYFSIQVGSGDDSIKYKNWSINNWIAFLKLLSDSFPTHHFILLGSAEDETLSKLVMQEGVVRVHSAVGKTNLREVIFLIQKSRIFLGHDGGLMHIAAFAGKPTFTIWGPTDNNLYGYEKINSKKHKVIRSDVYCRPCESWISPNTVRVTHPSQCPDFMCIQNVSADAAFIEFQIFYRELFSN